jgi:hypothetical protein
VPTAPGGLTPKVELDYNSQSQDGLTSSTNNQASWVGDGFDYSPGFVERSYQSCHQNPTGTTKTQDNCWSDNNTITLSLDGKTSTLVKDDTTGAWHPESDANERVQYKTGAVNGAQNGEYWVVTTDDGTQYYFGQNQLPGYASGDAATNSVWTEPVYATSSGQPCYNATFANSWCQQAYRWNLDYVVDPHQDAIAYYYTTETNYYARDLGTTANTSYIRGGYLRKITYGQRAGSVYSTTPAAQVLFTVNGRCSTSAGGCAASGLSSSTASSWPDVPYDLNCANGAACAVNSPTFWSEYELTGIQTQVLVGTTETNVDAWSLAHSFPATGDSTTPSLWLSSLTRTGQDTSAGGSSSSLSIPAVTLSGTALSNRVDVTDGYPPITRHRLNTITTETGEQISVAYSSAACGSGTPSDPSQNTQLCYPVYWVPPGQTSPTEDWFNKYVVTGVTEQDPTGGGVNDTITTHYTPVGSPAWHYDDNPLTPSSQRTWNQFRGYQGMKVTTGTSPDPVTETDYTYFRGMDGDTLPSGGTRSVTISDTRGDPAVTDADQFAGTTYETIAYNGSGSGKVVTDTVTDPWSSSATATHALSGLPAQHAYLTGQKEERVYTPLSSGATRETETDYTHDSYGRVTRTDDKGDVSTGNDDLCKTTTFSDNTSAWIMDRALERPGQARHRHDRRRHHHLPLRRRRQPRPAHRPRQCHPVPRRRERAAQREHQHQHPVRHPLLHRRRHDHRGTVQHRRHPVPHPGPAGHRHAGHRLPDLPGHPPPVPALRPDPWLHPERLARRQGIRRRHSRPHDQPGEPRRPRVRPHHRPLPVGRPHHGDHRPDTARRLRLRRKRPRHRQRPHRKAAVRPRHRLQRLHRHPGRLVHRPARLQQ